MPKSSGQAAPGGHGHLAPQEHEHGRRILDRHTPSLSRGIADAVVIQRNPDGTVAMKVLRKNGPLGVAVEPG